MALVLTPNALSKSRSLEKTPQLVLKMEGVDTIYGIGVVKRYAEIGYPGLMIEDPHSWVIGGLIGIDDQADLISFEKGTSSSLTQQLQPDRGTSSGVTSMTIALVDRAKEVTRLISPSIVVDDVLGRKAQVWLLFDDTSFPNDAILIHRGIIDDVISKPGAILLNIASPEQKKRQTIFTKATNTLNGAITNSDTTIAVDSTTNFLYPVNGPSGSPDSSISHYIQLSDELIKYTGVTSTTFTGCTRGQLGTVAAAHDDNADVGSFYRLEGDVLTLALKIMLSGWGGYFKTGVDITNFEYIDPTLSVPNAIFFRDLNIELEYGLTIGDYITTTGASNGANNVTLKTISDIVETDDGHYIVVNGVTFVSEIDSAATISFRSKYDTLGEGIKMSPDEVDVERHEYYQTTFLSSFNVDLYLKDTVETAKTLIEEQLYLPSACFSVPRVRSSVGYHIGPIPGTNTKILDSSNISKPSQISLRRTINRNFMNTVVYQFDVQSLDDKYLQGRIVTNATSKTQIPVGNKARIIKSDGMRASLQAQSLANSAANRLLNRYAFAAEFFEKIDVFFGEGFEIEVGDIVMLDVSDLNVSDTATGTREKPPKLFEVVNKTLDVKTGAVNLSLTDTTYTGMERYCLIGPSSKIAAAASAQTFTIKGGFGNSGVGGNEYLKWDKFTNPCVRVRSPNSVTRNDIGIIHNLVGNTVTLTAALSFTPQVDDIMELCSYADATEQIKLLYGHMKDSAFADGKTQYLML